LFVPSFHEDNGSAPAFCACEDGRHTISKTTVSPALTILPVLIPFMGHLFSSPPRALPGQFVDSAWVVNRFHAVDAQWPAFGDRSARQELPPY
jgi:hypothetical protein